MENALLSMMAACLMVVETVSDAQQRPRTCILNDLDTNIPKGSGRTSTKGRVLLNFTVDMMTAV